MAINMSTTDIPLFYRFVLTWFEPFSAVGGSILAFFIPDLYVRVMTPHAAHDPRLQVVLTQIAACYLLFAFIEAVLLRITRDLRIWTAIATGFLMCDTIHIYATDQALGRTVLVNPWAWRWEDWVNILTLVGMAGTRIAFLAGIGFPSTSKQKTR